MRMAIMPPCLVGALVMRSPNISVSAWKSKHVGESGRPTAVVDKEMARPRYRPIQCFVLNRLESSIVRPLNTEDTAPPTPAPGAH